MKTKRQGIFFSLLILSLNMAGQQFGGFSPSVKWKQIRTDTTRVIFTAGSESQAERITSIIHRVAADTLIDLGSRLRNINVVLHNRSTISNGYVALGPYRSEFFLIPGSSIFDFGNLPWQENLAIHEYRHVHQYNNFRKGLSKAFYYILGEQGQAFANALSVPDWFFEGDAVFAETAFSRQGRGRLPYFLSGYKSLWADGREYNWMKLRNGSLKDYVPNHYQLGYLLTDYGYKKYGGEFWKNVTSDASAFKGLFYPFQRAVKKHSGQDFKTFRNEALKNYQSEIRKGNENIKREVVTNYYYPQHISTDSLLYLKTAYNKIPAFYIATPAGEKKIALQNISSEEWFSYREGRIAYTAFSTHARWGLTNYNDIVLLDLNSGRETRLTSKERYYTPDISPSGEKVVAIRINDSLQTELMEINIDDQHSRRLMEAGDDLFFINPRYLDENRIVVGVREPSAKIALKIWDSRNGKWEEILPSSDHTTGLPYVNGSSVYFVSNVSGNDEIYVYNSDNKKIHQLSEAQTGNYYPSASGDSIVWSQFTSNGLALQRSALDKMLWKEIGAEEWKKGRFAMEPAIVKNIFPLPEERFPHKRYPKSTGFVNFHSWIPEYEDPELTVRLFSDNILNTFSNELFYRYNQNETSHGAGWNTYYGGWFPVISAGVEYTFNRSFPFRSSALDLNQAEARIGYNIPLNFSAGNYYKFLNPGSNFVFNRVMPTGLFKDSFLAENTTYLHHYLSWAHYLPRARQHIYPKFGWNSLFQFRHLTNGEGYQGVGNAFIYLPSIANHSLVLNLMFQETDTSNVSFSNRFAMSRGYSDYYFSRMWKVAGNYHFPLIYPDFGFANIAYILRVRGNLFYDFSRVYSRDKSQTRDFRSIGTEIFFDTKWWNQLPVSFGFRISRLLDDGRFQNEGKGSTFFEFILPVGLIPN